MLYTGTRLFILLQIFKVQYGFFSFGKEMDATYFLCFLSF